MTLPKGILGYHPPIETRPVKVWTEELGERVPLKSNSPNQWIAKTGMALRVLMGSSVYGTSVEGKGDRDELGICVEPPQYVIGNKVFKPYIFRTVEERKPVKNGISPCSEPGDLDLMVHSLRHYIYLAAAGNPTMLTPLFVPDSAVLYANDFGRELREYKGMLLSRKMAAKYKGYLHSQRRGLLGLRSGGTRNMGRRDIREEMGFDCYLDDTEFLTYCGWLTYDEILDGEAVGTVNQTTGEIEFQVPTERVAKPYSGPIHFFRHRYTACAVTPNHRMWSSPVNRGPSGRIGNVYREEVADWRFRAAGDLQRLHHVRVVGAIREREYPISDAQLALYGCYISEGHVAKRRKDGSASVLSMCQRVGGRLERPLASAEEEFPMNSYTYTRNDNRAYPCEYTVYNVANRALAKTVDEECGRGSHNIHLPPWAFSLSGRQAEILLDALIAGDGTLTKGGWHVYYSMSSRLAGDVQALAITAGRRSNVWGPYEPKGIYQVMIQDVDRQFETLSMHKNHRVEEVEGRVVCFTVPNETLVTRREGRVAMHGNTKFAAHMVRLGYEGAILMETGTVPLPLPEPYLTNLRELRRGERTKEWALSEAEKYEEKLSVLESTSKLPDAPDWQRINSWLIDVHLRHWGLK